MSAKVDVLEDLQSALREGESLAFGLPRSMEKIKSGKEAIAAVAELIAADREYDAAMAVSSDPRKPAPKEVVNRRYAARERRAAALAAVTGEGSDVDFRQRTFGARRFHLHRRTARRRAHGAGMGLRGLRLAVAQGIHPCGDGMNGAQQGGEVSDA